MPGMIDAEHCMQVRAAQISIDRSHARAELGHRQRQVECDDALADTALTAAYGDYQRCSFRRSVAGAYHAPPRPFSDTKLARTASPRTRDARLYRSLLRSTLVAFGLLASSFVTVQILVSCFDNYVSR